MSAVSSGPSVAVGPVTAFCNLAEQSVQQLYDFWRNRPTSLEDMTEWERSRDNREAIIAELDRLYYPALSAASSVFNGAVAEQRLKEIFDISSSFLRRGVPRDFSIHFGQTPAWVLELSGGCHPWEEARLAEPDVSPAERKDIESSTAALLSRVLDNKQRALQTFMTRKRDVDSALKSGRSMAAACGEGAPVRTLDETTSQDAPTEPPNETERAVLSILQSQPKGQGISAKEIIAALKKKRIILAESSLRKHILPKLKKHHGVTNHRSVGGYLIR